MLPCAKSEFTICFFAVCGSMWYFFTIPPLPCPAEAAPSSPTRTALFPLLGGSTIEKGGTTATSTGTITENVHAVTFDSQGDSTVNPIKVTHGKTAVKPGNPTRIGYAFGGWIRRAAALMPVLCVPPA